MGRAGRLKSSSEARRESLTDLPDCNDVEATRQMDYGAPTDYRRGDCDGRA
jgi:hypothetical protein